ncbi:hypothetical protein psal_cds_1362 [Pandoravirus salinus]|uniref:Uncharacterized protein n=1 Tax=Pandoravirus salinus TaxID=1349410 RepID=S4W1S6_9VIRU|nr:hypothetical protein psal_cds_1362 [Pandoravirus salinus]AGO85761.1 hypothetical protein psal_cds_1362 [Pandoravirus salinus]
MAALTTTNSHFIIKKVHRHALEARASSCNPLRSGCLCDVDQASARPHDNGHTGRDGNKNGCTWRPKQRLTVAELPKEAKEDDKRSSTKHPKKRLQPALVPAWECAKAPTSDTQRRDMSTFF